MKEDEIYLKDIAQALYLRKWTIIIGTLIIIIISGVISYLLPPTYESSTMLEIGKIYMPLNSVKEGEELLEEPKLMEEIINSGALLNKVSNDLRGDLQSGEKIIAHMEAETFEGGKLPLIEINCETRDPRDAFEFLTGVIKLFVDQHHRKYESNQKALNILIENQLGKIKTTEKTINAKIQHLDEIQKILNDGKQSIDEFKNDLRKLQSSPIAPVELLFFQSSSLNEGTFIAQLNQVQADLQVSIEKNQADIIAYRNLIVNIERRISLSKMTRVIKPVKIPEFPIKPIKILIIISGAIIGFVCMISFVFLRGALTRKDQ